MTTAEVLHELHARDIRLSVDGDRLSYDAPEGAMTAEVLTLLHQHKTALFALLQQTHASATPSAEPSADDAPPVAPATQETCTHQAYFPPPRPKARLANVGTVRMSGGRPVAAER